MFVNEGYENYKYLVKASDNYIILSNDNYASGTWENPDSINIIYQYIKPSILTIEGQMEFTNEETFERVETTSNYWDRGDACELTIAGLGILFFILFIINALTRFVRKGGIFFGQ